MTANPPPLPTLPMQLMLTMGCWLSSPFALRCANSAWPPSSNQPKNLAELQKALASEAKNRASDFLSGLLRYVETPYSRKVKEPPVIWRKGNARILDYGLGKTAGDPRPVVLFVPSLINRYYILDLEEERSLLRYLASQGLYPLVLDWDKPGKFEVDFNCADYITEILTPAVDFLAKTSGQKITLIGYCMGGILALAAAQLKNKQVSALALLATPWNFHCRQFKPFVVDNRWLPMIESATSAQKQLSADIIQSLFYMTDPWVFETKFRRFAGLDPDSRAAQDFVALERWVNDGVPMTSHVARDCLVEWAQKNAVASGKWQVAKEVIEPKKIKVPTFIAMPQNDHVVPRDCAMPLAEALSKAEVIHPSAGHVGMIVGGRAKKELWEPLVQWVKSQTSRNRHKHS